MADESTKVAASQSLVEELSLPAPLTCHSEKVNFTTVGLPIYDGSFALLIHDLLSPDESALLLAAAEAAANNIWTGAMVNIRGGRQRLMTDVRLCDRILWDEPTLTETLFARIKPHLPENILALQNNARITGYGPLKRKETWKASRLNERLRFLKYTSGMYFREHCDGSYVTPDGTEVSFLTIHIYLNGTEPKDGGLPLKGGATRFFSPSMKDHYNVNPRTGSCLVFQHRGLIHSGEEVVTGTKFTLRTDVMYKKVDSAS
jgi:2OG-Fe(II) oxygenase superfamily